MDDSNITWDPNKNKQNVAKHNISFDEAKTVFYDQNAQVIHDPDHSIEENRFIILGLSQLLNLLVVCHSYREKDDIVRIISARKASKNETKHYEG
ncbi:MAG: BrnT family toxin [Spirochaetaceae bacterium]|jgi:uncharacterized DUF497 family protein|nr:BrnT family toxin [Spirochaetaceae bacterium]